MNTFSPDYNENKINNILLSLSKEISSFSNLKNPSINLKKRREFFIKELEDLTFDASRHNISIENKLIGGYGPVSTIYKNSDGNFIGVPDIRVGTEKAFNSS